MTNYMMLWMGVLILAIVVEAATLGLTSIWFVGGALAAIMVAALHLPLTVQVVVFLVVSILLLVFTRPVALKYFNKDRIKTNVEGLVGLQAIVTETIDNLHATGQVIVGGLEWSARSLQEEVILPQGAVVEVMAVSGVKLIVREAEARNQKETEKISAEEKQ